MATSCLDLDLHRLARGQSRRLAAIEEALLVRELVQGLGLSQHEVARRGGRDVSWVSRRLQLLAELPDAIVAAVIEGRLSSWGLNDGLRDGPEGSCEIVLRRINVLIRSVRKQLPNLRPLSADLIAAFSLVQTSFEGLDQEIKRYVEDDLGGDPRQRACSQGARP